MKLSKLIQFSCNNCINKESRIICLSLFYIFVVIVFTACNSSLKKSYTLKEQQEAVTFDMGFQYTTEIQLFEYNGEEYIGFANLRTNKKISVFDSKGMHQFSVSVDSAIIKENNYFSSFDFITMDSIILISAYTNKIVVLDTSGKIIYKKDYSTLLDNAEISPPFCFINQQLRCAVHYNYNLPENPTKEDYINANETRLSFSNMMFDTALYTNEKPILQLDSIYSRFSTKNQKVTEGIHILMLDSLNVFYSAYSDSLYIFDLQGNLTKIVPLKSKYTDIKLTPVDQDSDLLNKNFRENGFISDLYWDKYRKVYYCFVRSAMIDKKLPFSVIILDKEFNILSETSFDYEKYLLSAFVGKEGLYIRNVNTEDFKRHTFTLFKYE